MAFVRRTVKFGGGLVLGAAVSTAVSVLLAPQSGPELQGEISDRAEEARRAGDEAEIIETERLKREFRMKVNDPAALTGRPPAPESEAEKKARKEQQEAEKARKQADKARQDAEKRRQQVAKDEQRRAKDQEQVAKAQDKVREAEEKARKEQQEADEARAKARA